MANTNVLFKHKDMNRDEETLCFICATKRALKLNPEKEQIYIESTSYEFSTCRDCGEPLRDTIEI